MIMVSLSTKIKDFEAYDWWQKMDKVSRWAQKTNPYTQPKTWQRESEIHSQVPEGTVKTVLPLILVIIPGDLIKEDYANWLIRSWRSSQQRKVYP